MSSERIGEKEQSQKNWKNSVAANTLEENIHCQRGLHRGEGDEEMNYYSAHSNWGGCELLNGLSDDRQTNR